jgi:hypothetical protein
MGRKLLYFYATGNYQQSASWPLAIHLTCWYETDVTSVASWRPASANSEEQFLSRVSWSVSAGTANSYGTTTTRLKFSGHFIVFVISCFTRCLISAVERRKNRLSMYHEMKRRVGTNFNVFLTSALDGEKRPGVSSSRFTHKTKHPVLKFVGRWMGLRDRLTWSPRKNFSSLPGIESSLYVS